MKNRWELIYHGILESLTVIMLCCTRQCRVSRTVPRAHCLCSHRLSSIAFSARQAGWRRSASSSLSLPLRFSLRKHRRSYRGELAPGRSSSLVPWDSRARSGGETVPGGHKDRAAWPSNVASLPGNLLVMLISTYKPFIIVDEQLIRLPAPLPWQC